MSEIFFGDASRQVSFETALSKKNSEAVSKGPLLPWQKTACLCQEAVTQADSTQKYYARQHGIKNNFATFMPIGWQSLSFRKQKTAESKRLVSNKTRWKTRES
jgi:hypothetical protein